MDDIQTQKPFWSLTVEETLVQLKSSLMGLSKDEAEIRQKHFGINRLERVHKFTKLAIFFRQFQSPLIFILIIAGITTLLSREYIDAAVIFLAIGVNVMLGFYQESRAEASLENLHSYIKERVRVMRDGVEQELDAEQLVPGDIIHLGYGVRVPADVRLLSMSDFSVDESILTGESVPVAKSLPVISEAMALPERVNMAFGGTLVVEGYASGIVTTIGLNTEIGKIAELVERAEQTKTPLQTAVDKLAWIIAVLSTILIIVLVLLGISKGQPLLDMFLVSAAVAVGAIPEALPIALTVVLAVGVEQLARRKGIMRNLAAAETLGSTSVILTDKTGTLTQANLSLIDIIEVKKLVDDGELTFRKEPLMHISSEQRELLSLAALNTDVLIQNSEGTPDTWQIIGRPLETQIVRSAALHQVPILKMRADERYQLVLPFNSVNKFSVSRIHSSKSLMCPIPKCKDFWVVIGAPDVLLERSALSKEEYLAAKKHVETMSNDGKRVLGVAVFSAEGKRSDDTITAELVTDISFLGILAFFDPIRPGVPEAIKKMENSGVKIIMATGDLKGTAVSVARDLGWDVTEGEVLTGDELKRLSDAELLENIENIKVYARVTPEDKMRIGMLFKQKGEIVGMTGDGVNDAPSLKSVDIGIAVGSGSDVAKGVADLVLLDDNFETIVAAIEEGRRILGNIRKSFVYLMSSSFDEVILVGGSLLFGLSLPLTALQIIWVNFFTGSLPALSFAFDNLIDIKKTTVASSREIINSEVKALTLGIGTISSAILFVLYWYLLSLPIPELEAKTFLFACFASYILIISFSLRSLQKPLFAYNPFSNKFLTLSVLIGVVLIAVTLYVPFLQRIFGTTTLSIRWLGWLLVWNIFNVGLIEVAKWFYYRKAS